MEKLTKKYIYEHQNNVHTYDSFGRAIIEQILKAGYDSVDEGQDSKLELNGKITISPYEPLKCLRVCVNINGILVCYHVS